MEEEALKEGGGCIHDFACRIYMTVDFGIPMETGQSTPGIRRTQIVIEGGWRGGIGYVGGALRKTACICTPVFCSSGSTELPDGPRAQKVVVSRLLVTQSARVREGEFYM